MTEFFTLFMLAITIEALIEYGKLIFRKTINWKQLTAIFVAVGLAILAQKDLYALLGLTFVVPYVGMILTGIFISRGSNYIADFIKKLQVQKIGD